MLLKKKMQFPPSTFRNPRLRTSDLGEKMDLLCTVLELAKPGSSGSHDKDIFQLKS